jgi:hypothetical protein
MIEVPRRQVCACGNGCDERSSVKWNGYLVVSCVPDDEARGVVEAIMEAARRSIADERAAVVAWLRREIAKCGCDDDTAACIERGEHRREEEP